MRIAVAQTPGTHFDQWPNTWALIEQLVHDAAAQKADLVVLPECVWPAYCLGTQAAYVAARAAGLPGPRDFLAYLAGLAAKLRIAICAGYVAEDGPQLRNAACFIGPDGRVLGTYHKCFLWGADSAYFARGNRIAPFDTPYGRIGLMVCADARLPEIPATLAARGAELILHPTAWVNAAAPGPPWNPQPDFLISARAAEFGVPIASASKYGRERDVDFVGQSLICDRAGKILVQAGMNETCVLVAEVEPAPPRRPRLTPAERSALLSPAAPLLPRADVAAFVVVAANDDADVPELAACVRGVHPAASTVLVLLPDHALLRHESAAATRETEPVRIAAGTDLLVDMNGCCIGAVRDTDAVCFGAVRAMALRGAHAIVVFGDAVTLPQLRARACENRVFLFHARRRGWRMIDPAGRLVGDWAWPRGFAEARPQVVDAALAAEKAVAPGTNMLLDRHVGEYAL